METLNIECYVKSVEMFGSPSVPYWKVTLGHGSGEFSLNVPEASEAAIFSPGLSILVVIKVPLDCA